MEVRHVLYKKLLCLWFIDGGQLYTQAVGDPWPYIRAKSLGDFAYGTGPGLRLNTPVGAVRLEVGYQLNPADENAPFFSTDIDPFFTGRGVLMVKRFFLFAVLADVSGSLLIFHWQPDSLKKRLLNAAAQTLSKSAPVDIVIGRVSGNLFNEFSLENVAFLSKTDHAPLWKSKTITIQYSPSGAFSQNHPNESPAHPPRKWTAAFGEPA